MVKAALEALLILTVVIAAGMFLAFMLEPDLFGRQLIRDRRRRRQGRLTSRELDALFFKIQREANAEDYDYLMSHYKLATDKHEGPVVLRAHMFSGNVNQKWRWRQ